MAIQSGTNSNLRAWSLVITVFPVGQFSYIRNPVRTLNSKMKYKCKQDLQSEGMVDITLGKYKEKEVH